MLTETHAETCIDRCGARIDLRFVEATVRAGRRPGEELAFDRRLLWPIGHTLRISFLDGTPKMHEAVEQIAKEWERYANITFQFGDFTDSHVRVSFESAVPGYWSYLGRDALEFSQKEPTMSLTRRWNDAFLLRNPTEVRRTVLHEFGHALGLIHEHSSPAAGIPWDTEKVYEWYARMNWSREEVDQQVLRRYDESWHQSSQYDPKSIMHYPVPRSLTTGGFEIGWNTTLSETDKIAIASVYPRDD